MDGVSESQEDMVSISFESGTQTSFSTNDILK